MDPTGRRNGQAASAKGKEVLLETLEKSEKYISKCQVAAKVTFTASKLRDVIDEICGAVMIAYPMGLPAWDPVRQILESAGGDTSDASLEDDLSPEDTELWFAGKKLLSGNTLADHVGKNDKTKVVIKVTRKGQGAPAREPVVDEETQKAMMAWYFKKQEEQKKLAEDDGAYTNHSAWANPKALKGHFSGVSRVKMPF
eukprot:jgi/Botrbrau1/11592/Bobra.247_1s0013.2